MTRRLSSPFANAPWGGPAVVDEGVSVREQLELLLFTLPGERLNRPELGCGVQRLVFAGASPEVAAAAEYSIGTAIRRYLGDRLRFEAVKVWVDDVTLTVDVLYTVRATGEERADSFRRVLESPR